MSKEWETQRDKLLTDLKNVYKILAESPIWNQLVVKSKALKSQVDKTVGETKEQVQESVDKLGADAAKLKEDLKCILQLGMFPAQFFLVVYLRIFFKLSARTDPACNLS